MIANRDLRVHDWTMTSSGLPFWPLRPRSEDVRIEDIAHALANLCRYTGHVRSFYSVAHHSVLVSRVVPREVALWGLLHDASEAYLHDLPRPIKHLPELAAYRAAEAAVMRAVCERFGLPADEPEEVRVADRRMLRTEQRDLMPPELPGEGRDDVEPYLFTIERPLPPVLARRAFLDRFAELTGTAASDEPCEPTVVLAGHDNTPRPSYAHAPNCGGWTGAALDRVRMTTRRCDCAVAEVERLRAELAAAEDRERRWIDEAGRRATTETT